MTHKDAPPERPSQTAMREFCTQMLAPRGVTVGWGRGKDGQFLSQYAKDAEDIWLAAIRWQEEKLHD